MADESKHDDKDGYLPIGEDELVDDILSTTHVDLPDPDDPDDPTTKEPPMRRRWTERRRAPEPESES